MPASRQVKNRKTKGFSFEIFNLDIEICLYLVSCILVSSNVIYFYGLNTEIFQFNSTTRETI